MLRAGWEQAVENFPLGCGFGCTGIRVDGVYTVIHMTYLQILGEGGVISLIGYLWFILFPIWQGVKYITEKRELLLERVDTMLAPISVLILYLFIGFFHPLSNELTEWAVVITAVSIIQNVAYRK